MNYTEAAEVEVGPTRITLHGARVFTREVEAEAQGSYKQLKYAPIIHAASQ